MDTFKLDPIIYKKIKKYIKNGKLLKDILQENIGTNFSKEIISHYYHLNNGPDLRDYQLNVINYLKKYYKNNDVYKLFWCCGLGKTKTSLTISKQLNFKSILVFVPSKILIKQFQNELELLFLNNKIFINDSEHNNLDESLLLKYLSKKIKHKIILSTYHSSNKLFDILNKINFKFDFVIYDECHHLLNKNSKKFIYALKITANKKLYLTATPYEKEETKQVYSMIDSSYFKGEFDRKEIKWAISNNHITDYKIMICNSN